MQLPLRSALVLMVVMVLLGGCASQGGSGGPAVLPILDRQCGFNAEQTTPVMVLVNSQEELDALGLAGVETPDFKKQSMIVVAMGEQPTTGYSVDVTGLSRDGDTVYVSATMVRPGKDAVTAQVLTQPYCAVTTTKLKKVTLASDFSAGG